MLLFFDTTKPRLFFRSPKKQGLLFFGHQKKKGFDSLLPRNKGFVFLVTKKKRFDSLLPKNKDVVFWSPKNTRFLCLVTRKLAAGINRSWRIHHIR